MKENGPTFSTVLFMVGMIVLLAGLAYYLVTSMPGLDEAGISATSSTDSTNLSTDQGSISALSPDTANSSSSDSTGTPATGTGTSTNAGTSTRGNY